MAVLAVAAAVAVMFGVWLAVAGESGVFGRLTGLVGVCLLVLVAIAATVGMFAWAQQLPDAQPPAPQSARIQPPALLSVGTQRSAPDMVVIPVPSPGGYGSDTVPFPVVMLSDAPHPPPRSQHPVDPMAELEALWAARPDGVRAGVLELMSVLSAAGIRRDMVYAAGRAGLLGGRGAAAGEDVVAGALRQLAAGLLLSFSRDGRVVSAGRPVLVAVRDRLAGQERLAAACQVAARVLEARCEALARSPNRLAVLDVPGQVSALREVVAGLAGEPGAGLAGALLRLRGWALYYLNVLGDQAERAIVIGELLIADQERVLGPDDPNTLAARNNLANAYEVAGRFDEAVALHERVLAGRERVLGPGHPHTGQSRKNLAAARAAHPAAEASADEQALADPGEQTTADPEAVALHEQVPADREETLGYDHPDTMDSRNDLANPPPG